MVKQHLDTVSVKKTIIIKLSFFFFVFLYSSCYCPKVQVKLKNTYPPLSDDISVVTYRSGNDVPTDSEDLGKLSILCSDQIKCNCDTLSLLPIAENEVRKAGGNALLIKKYKEPTSIRSESSLQGNILKVFDFLSPPDSLYSERTTPKITIQRKGNWDLTLSIPYINGFYLKPEGEEIVSNTGFWGIMGSIHYYHKKINI